MNADKIIVNDFINKHPFAAAHALELLSSQEVTDFIQTLPFEKILRLFALMDTEKAAECFLLLPSQQTTELIEIGDPYFIASLLKLIEEPTQKKLLHPVSEDKIALIVRNMENVPNTVGAFMEIALCVNKEMTVADATLIVKRNIAEEEFYLYVVDLEGIFKGIVRLKELLIADNNDSLEDLMIITIPKFFPEIPIKSVLNDISWTHYRYIPVVDKSNKLLGTLSYSTIVEITQKSTDAVPNDIMDTGGALGELYLIGLTGLLQSVGK